MGYIRDSWRKPVATAIKCYRVKKFIAALGNIGLLLKTKRREVHIILFTVFMQVLPWE
jgi:hypothetical protein